MRLGEMCNLRRFSIQPAAFSIAENLTALAFVEAMSNTGAL